MGDICAKIRKKKNNWKHFNCNIFFSSSICGHVSTLCSFEWGHTPIHQLLLLNMSENTLYSPAFSRSQTVVWNSFHLLSCSGTPERIWTCSISESKWHEQRGLFNPSFPFGTHGYLLGILWSSLKNSIMTLTVSLTPISLQQHLLDILNPYIYWTWSSLSVIVCFPQYNSVHISM